ncbi:hypothetical protein R9C00_23300 [Flammeovirgaceae bacterium SG7u.111]|nr:hypothetical protein [Flammeovirgaceae bacterium SG7u.132]WPO34633.1 hypothetical protein R9C00_23300 [Flammeovirgaceae bacterium SG7u.111]
MKVRSEAQLAVKWACGGWTCYRVTKHRDFGGLVDYFTGLPHFRFAVLYEWDRKTKARGRQIGYFSKKESYII